MAVLFPIYFIFLYVEIIALYFRSLFSLLLYDRILLYRANIKKTRFILGGFMKHAQKLYQEHMINNGFVLDEEQSNTEAGLYTYKLVKNGEGTSTHYYYKNYFIIDKKDYRFHEDFFLECKEFDNLHIQYFYLVSGEELFPYRQLSPHSLRCHIGKENQYYKAIYHKNIPVRAIGIHILPAFYHQYLKHIDDHLLQLLSHTFYQFSNGADFVEFTNVLKAIDAFQGSKEEAELYYQEKIFEALKLLFDFSTKRETNNEAILITEKDASNLECIANYIEHHYNFTISNHHLCRIAHMSNTTLKTKFKKYFGVTITDYILKKRIEQAQHLLMNSTLSIREIAKIVGYNRGEYFSKQFYKLTGLLPNEYRNLLR